MGIGIVISFSLGFVIGGVPGVLLYIGLTWTRLVGRGPRGRRRSTLGLDLYLWLTYRTFPLTKPLPLTRPPTRTFTLVPASLSSTGPWHLVFTSHRRA